MNITHSVSEILEKLVTLTVEGIDRMYLNVYVPRLQYAGGVARFIRLHMGNPVASTVMVAPLTAAFVKSIRKFSDQIGVPIHGFEKGEKKEETAREALSKFSEEEGVFLIGRAQEKATVPRVEQRRDVAGQKYPWIIKSTAFVNQFYFYCLDRDFGPFFLKFCSYFPFNAKLCINGHEYAKRQLDREGIGYVALDNGFQSCDDPERLQAICDGLSAGKIDALLRKWFTRLPHPFTEQDRDADYGYDISILQSEFALTQVFDRPLSGRLFFEQVLHENLDLGRPKQIQLIFDRRVTKRTPGRFRTRVITDGVIPSLYVDYKTSRVHQYFKGGRALRTETTINNPKDFKIGKRLHNLPALRQIGFNANRRLLDVQKLSHDCTIGETCFRKLQSPQCVQGQRVPALRFGDPKVDALLQALVNFRLNVAGFSNRDLREYIAPLLGLRPNKITPGSMTYHLRRIRLHDLIERIPRTNRYTVTIFGLRVALFYTRTTSRILRTGLALSHPHSQDNKLHNAFNRLEQAIEEHCKQAKLAA